MQVYDRKRKTIITEFGYGSEKLQFLYDTCVGRILLKLIFARPWFSKLTGIYYKTRLSHKKLAPYISIHRVDMCGKTIADFKTFNDFFIRKKENFPIDYNANSLIAVADSRFSYYNIDSNFLINIKNSVYSIPELIDNKRLAKQFVGGTCLVFRLSVDDVHRYIYPDTGKHVATRFIKGCLHAIHPISKKYRVFARNAREFHMFDMDNLGRIAWIEVGALLVGKMHNHDVDEFKRGDEKGYFEMGGSTIIILLSKDIRIDNDIAQMNSQGIETLVKMGEKIGIVR